jgi:hypothetical protein
MISNFRLFAGLTSLKSWRALSHFFSSGPEGILASKFISLHNSGQHRDRNRAVTHQQNNRDELRKTVDERLPIAIAQSERLKHRADAMAQVQAKQRDADDVEHRNNRLPEAEDHHSINVVRPLRDRAIPAKFDSRSIDRLHHNV